MDAHNSNLPNLSQVTGPFTSRVDGTMILFNTAKKPPHFVSGHHFCIERQKMAVDIDYIAQVCSFFVFLLL